MEPNRPPGKAESSGRLAHSSGRLQASLRVTASVGRREWEGEPGREPDKCGQRQEIEGSNDLTPILGSQTSPRPKDGGWLPSRVRSHAGLLWDYPCFIS